MTEKIQTRVFNYGDPKESSWPPMFGTGGTGVYHISKHTGELEEGYPAPEIVPFGVAPMISMGTIRPEVHPGTGEVVDTVKKWDEVNNVLGYTTHAKHSPAKSKRAEWLKQSSVERKEAMRKSIAQLDAGNAPLNEEQRALCKIQNDIVSDALGFNAHDVAGRKNSAEGKRFRKRYNRGS